MPAAMRRARVWSVVLAVLAVGAPFATAVRGQQDPIRESAVYAAKAVDAYKAKDYPEFLASTQRACELRPNHPRLMYNLACALALNGKRKEAAAVLGKVADMGLVYPAAEDGNFAALRDDAAFRSVIARFDANTAPVHHAERAFTIPERGFINEGLAYDPVEGAFYASSVHLRKIVRIDRTGKVSDFAADRSELWSAFGMRVDAKRRILWVTTATTAQMTGAASESEGRSAVLEYDLRTRKLLRAHVLPADSEKHAISDIEIGPDSTVYVTDSLSPALYAVRDGKLQKVATSAPFVSPQGLTFSADARRLYVADYTRGVFVVDPKTGAWSLLETPASMCLLGIDGLARSGDSLVAVQNGVRPTRVVRITLDSAGARAERLEVLEANTPGLEEPTLGIVVDGWFYFVANSQWNRFDEKGNLPPASELHDHVVMRVKL